MHELSFLLEIDQKYSPNKLSYSVSSTALKRARDKKTLNSSKSAALRQEVKVLAQIGKKVMFYQWLCNYGRLISVCRTRSSHWWRSHRAWKERDLCVRSSSSTWQASLWPPGWRSPGCPGSGSPCSHCVPPPMTGVCSVLHQKKTPTKPKTKPAGTAFERGGCAHG